MGILRTLGRVFAGFCLACLAAALVQVLFVETPADLAAVPASTFPAEARSAFEQVLFAATQFAIFAAAFAFIAAGIAEWLGLRNVGYWLAAGVGIAILGFIAQYASEVSGQPSILNNYALQSYLTAGFFGGLVYWLVAGMRSGAARERLAAEALAAPPPRIIVEKAPRARMGSLAEKLAMKRASKEAASLKTADGKPQEAPPAPAPAPAPSMSAAGSAKPAQSQAAKPAPQTPASPKASAAPGATTAVPVTRPEPAKADPKAEKGE